jgi:hypothetical protein
LPRDLHRRWRWEGEEGRRFVGKKGVKQNTLSSMGRAAILKKEVAFKDNDDTIISR